MKTCFQDFKKRSSISANYNKPNMFKTEGVDHLNVSIQSTSKLGRILDPGYCCFLEYPNIGKFKSVLALGYWLRSPELDDTIRSLSGSKLKQYAKEHNLYSKKVINYMAILAKATWIRISQREDILKEIRGLPDDINLLSYYTHKSSSIRITTNYAPMVVAIASEIIGAVKEQREPDFDQFVTNKELSGMEYLDGVLSKHQK